jgi:hypothetical protein
MVTLLLFLIATIGATNILVHGDILDKDHLGFRPWLKKRLGNYQDLLDCYECSGFYCAVAVGFLLTSTIGTYWILGIVAVVASYFLLMRSFLATYDSNKVDRIENCVVFMTFFALVILTSDLATLFVMGLAGCAVMHFYTVLNNYIQSKTDYVVSEEDEQNK